MNTEWISTTKGIAAAATEYLGRRVAPATVQSWIRDGYGACGNLPVANPGGASRANPHRIRRADLTQWLDQHEAEVAETKDRARRRRHAEWVDYQMSHVERSRAMRDAGWNGFEMDYEW